MIWEFYKYEKDHGKKMIPLDPVLNGKNRELIFVNDPPNQRLCHCQGCHLDIPREVPRIKRVGQYYYGSGYLCMDCGMKELKEKKAEFLEIVAVSEKVFEDEFYEKKMALAKLCQVVAGKDELSQQ
jgi:hypothetical protein